MAKDFVGDYAASRRPFGNPVGVDANTNAMDDEVAGMLATLRRLREQRQAREREATMAFPKPEGPEAAAPTSSAMAKFGSSPAAAEASMRAAQEEEERKAFWSAVEAGSTPAIDAALDATGQSAEMLRQRKAALELEAKKYESERDPALRARARQVFEAEYKALADDEKTVQEYQDRVIKGIAARQAGDFQASAEMDSIGARYGKVAMPTLRGIGTALDKLVSAGGGQAAAAFDVLTGRGLPDATFAIPVVGAFMEPTQRRGEVFRQELGSALAGTFRGEGEGAEGLVSKYNPWSLTVRGANALGAGLANLGEAPPVDAATDPLGAAATAPVRMLGKAYGAAADFVSGAKTPEERATKYMDATAQVIADTILDPTSAIDLPLGRILGKALKPLEPLLEGALKRAGTTKYNARTALASLAGKIRAYTVGGMPLEDPDFAAWALKSEAARVAYSKDLHLAAMEHRAKIEGKLAAIPPELREDVQARVVPELLERSRPEEAALKNIPPQHRAAVAAYVSSIADANEARKVLLAARGINVELADDVLLGYANRRWSPEFQFWLAKHPEVTAALGELKLAQHYNATGQAIPDTNQFAKRKFRAETFDEAEEILRQKFGYTGRDIWDRNWRDVVVGDMLFAANAARRKADFDTFLEVFAKKGGPGEYDKGMMPVGELAEKLRMEIPPQYTDMMVSRNQANMFLKNNVPDDPSVLRQRINRITNWVSRSVLATPGSVTKDVKGQIINAAITDPRIFAYLDQSFAAIKKGVPDEDLAVLEARGLARPSFEAEIAPSTIAAAREFGGSAAAATIEESGFVGGAIRGLGAAAKKVPAIGAPVGKALEKTGRAIGAVGRASLTARQTSEEVFRLATYKAAKARGLSQEEALLEVAKYWGDFSQLSKLEKGVLKGFVLFFSWQLRALKIGVHQIVDHPFRTRLFLSLTAGDVADREDFPIWARRQGGTVIGKDDAGNPKFISLAAGSYFDPLSEVLQGEAMQLMRTDGLKGAVAGLAQQGLRRLAPMFQAPIEYATNYDSFSGSQIRLEDRQDTRTRTSDHAPAAALWLPEPMKKFLGVEPVYDSKTGALSYVRMDPTLNWLFNKTMPGVGAQLAGTLNPAADPRKSTLEAVGRGVLGTPTYSVRPVDMTGVAKEKVRAAQEALRRSLDRTGLAMNSDGAVRFDDRTDLGRAMLADNERWVREARDLGYSAEGYVRFKMANKYEDALRLIDLANRLRFADEAVAGESLRPAKPLKGLSDEGAANLSPRVLGLQQRQDQSRRNRLRSLGGPR